MIDILTFSEVVANATALVDAAHTSLGDRMTLLEEIVANALADANDGGRITWLESIIAVLEIFILVLGTVAVIFSFFGYQALKKMLVETTKETVKETAEKKVLDIMGSSKITKFIQSSIQQAVSDKLGNEKNNPNRPGGKEES